MFKIKTYYWEILQRYSLLEFENELWFYRSTNAEDDLVGISARLLSFRLEDVNEPGKLNLFQN